MNFREHFSKQLQNPAFYKEYKALEPAYEIIRQVLKAGIEQNITQKELAERVGMKQSTISRLESGNYNPSLDFLQKIAVGLGKELHIEFRDPAGTDRI